jgi:hypothetical protein
MATYAFLRAFLEGDLSAAERAELRYYQSVVGRSPQVASD